jgi:hypothetical protein
MMINKKTLKEFDYIQYFVFKITGNGIFLKADTEKIVFHDFFSIFLLKENSMFYFHLHMVICSQYFVQYFVI